MIVIESHYLPSLEYFTILSRTNSLHLDVKHPFQKQTFRNRCYVLGSNKVLPLIVPVHYRQGTPFNEVKIDNRQSWARDHWGAISSAYGKSPFFEYFAEEFMTVLKSKPNLLMDLNHAMLSVCMKVLQWKAKKFEEVPKPLFTDLRNVILPKQSYKTRDFYQPIPYQQNFGNTFVPNLSILDLLFCQGSEAGNILKNSVKAPIEPFMD